MRFLQVSDGKFLAMAYSPDGRYLATGHGNGTVRLWSTASAEIVVERRASTAGRTEPPAQRQAAFLSADRFVMMHHNGGTLWEFLEDPAPILEPWREFAFPVNSFGGGGFLVPHPDGDRFFVTLGPMLWEQPVGFEPARRYLLTHRWDAPLCSAAVHPDGAILATSSAAGFVDVWDMDSLAPLSQGDARRNWRFDRGRWPDLAAEPLRRLKTVGGAATRLHFDSNGRRLIAVTAGQVITWDTASWELSEFPLDGIGTRATAVSPDGRTLLVATSGREVITYDLDSAWERGRFAFDIGKLGRLAFSPDGTTAAAGGGGKRLAIWDVD